MNSHHMRIQPMTTRLLCVRAILAVMTIWALSSILLWEGAFPVFAQRTHTARELMDLLVLFQALDAFAGNIIAALACALVVRIGAHHVHRSILSWLTWVTLLLVTVFWFLVGLSMCETWILSWSFPLTPEQPLSVDWYWPLGGLLVKPLVFTMCLVAEENQRACQ